MFDNTTTEWVEEDGLGYLQIPSGQPIQLKVHIFD